MKSLTVKASLILSSLLFVACAHAGRTHATAQKYDHTVIEGSTGSLKTPAELALTLTNADVIVLGEKHNTPSVQKAQAEIIQSTLRENYRDFVVGWEFLNVSDKSNTARSWIQYRQNLITGLEFLKNTQGNLLNDSYLPILDVTRTMRGRLIGTNLSRAEKAPVVEKGIDGLNPALLPPEFTEGSDLYRERFYKVMSEHAPADKLKNYFTAQSLVDDVMAYHLTQDEHALKFLVTGSFHMDYNDAAIARIKARVPTARVVGVRVIDASDYTEAELSALKSDPRYGTIADYLFFVNEPAEQ